MNTDTYRAAFARAHGGRHTVQLGRGRSILPGVVITPENIADDARTVFYVARMVDDTNPAHMRLMKVTEKSVSKRANFVCSSCDDAGGYVRWSLTFDSPVLSVSA